MKKDVALQRSFERILQLREKEQLHELYRLKKKMDRAERTFLRREFREAADASRKTGIILINPHRLGRRASRTYSLMQAYAEHISGVECHLYANSRSKAVRAEMRPAVDAMIRGRIGDADKKSMRIFQTLLYWSTFGGGRIANAPKQGMISYAFELPGNIAVVDLSTMKDLYDLGFIKSNKVYTSESNLTHYGRATLMRLNERFGPCDEEIEILTEQMPRIFSTQKHTVVNLA